MFQPMSNVNFSLVCNRTKYDVILQLHHKFTTMYFFNNCYLNVGHTRQLVGPQCGPQATRWTTLVYRTKPSPFHQCCVKYSRKPDYL